MASKAIQVTDKEKDEEGVEEVEVFVPGVGAVLSYYRVESVDDVSGKPEEGIKTLTFGVPVEEKEDDSEETYFRVQQYEIDLAETSRAKLAKALELFIKAGRKVEPQAPVITRNTGPNQERSEWLARAKEWLRRAGHDVKDRGRVPKDKLDLYVKNNPSDPQP